MKALSWIFLTFFLLCVLTSSAYAGDEVTINQGLQANAGGTYILPAGTYTVTDQIIIPENTVLQGEYSESGELLSQIVISSSLKLGEQVPIVAISSGCKILYIDFNGNSENRPTVPAAGHSSNGVKQWGGGYDNFIGGKHLNDVRVAYCNFYNNLGDGFRFWYSSNIEFDHNTAAKGGHDVFYATRSEGIWAHDNYIQPRVNSAFRAMDCKGLMFSNNTIIYVNEYDGVRYDMGPAIQIQNDNGEMNQIEVCYNTIYYSQGPGFWIVGKTHTGKQNANIHNNVMYEPGSNHGIYWAAGMIISGYDNLNIQNNVFDGAYRGGIVYYAVNPGWATEASSIVTANIFTDAKPGASDGRGGYGILNQINGQSVSSSENCYYNNPAGNTEGCSVSSSDLFINPRSSSTPSGYTWDGARWNCPGMPPASLDYVPSGVYDGMDPITPEEEAEFEFNSIFDVTKMEFSESGNVEQGTIKALDPDWETKGNTKAYIYLAGYKGQITYDNITYIPEPASKCAMVLTDTKNIANRPAGQTSSLTLSDEGDNALKATLKVKTKYKVKDYKTVSIGEKSIKVPYYKEKTEKKTFTQTFTAPDVYPVQSPDDVNVTVTYQNNSYNPHTIVEIEGKRTGTIYKYNGSEAREFLSIGYVDQAPNGFKTTNFKPTATWKFSDDQMSYSYQALYIKGKFDPELLNINVTTPYTEFPVTEFHYTEIGDPTKTKINPAPFVIIIVLFIIFRPLLQELSYNFGRFR